jgi:hypothetical protein
MDSAEIAVVLGGLLLITFTLWFFFGAGDEDADFADREGKPLYECPMHAWITSSDPAANCSICGMKLVRRGDASVQQTR